MIEVCCGTASRKCSAEIKFAADTLPLDLSVQLRANREDLVLPDNHGQIWTELTTLARQDETLFQGSTKLMEEQMSTTLGLNGLTKFPVRRLGTLWRNSHWRSVITRWCQFPLGQHTFNISTFEWMSSCRLDDVRENVPSHHCSLHALTCLRIVLVCTPQPSDGHPALDPRAVCR
jgi:hypothetical protein